MTVLKVVARWLACHVLDHHDDLPRRVGVNHRRWCLRCGRLGATY